MSGTLAVLILGRDVPMWAVVAAPLLLLLLAAVRGRGRNVQPPGDTFQDLEALYQYREEDNAQQIRIAIVTIMRGYGASEREVQDVMRGRTNRWRFTYLGQVEQVMIINYSEGSLQFASRGPGDRSDRMGPSYFANCGDKLLSSAIIARVSNAFPRQDSPR